MMTKHILEVLVQEHKTSVTDTY